MNVRVLLLSSDEHRMVVGYVALSKQEMKIIEFIHVHGSAKKGHLIRFYGISGPATGEEPPRRVKQNLTRTTGKWHIIGYM